MLVNSRPRCDLLRNIRELEPAPAFRAVERKAVPGRISLSARGDVVSNVAARSANGCSYPERRRMGRDQVREPIGLGPTTYPQSTIRTVAQYLTESFVPLEAGTQLDGLTRAQRSEVGPERRFPEKTSWEGQREGVPQ